MPTRHTPFIMWINALRLCLPHRGGLTRSRYVLVRRLGFTRLSLIRGRDTRASEGRVDVIDC
jgi:hypothetical protein